MLSEVLYVKIYSDRVVAKNVSRGDSFVVVPNSPYTHPRLLIGNISQAELAVQMAIAKVKPSNPLKAIKVLIHPIHDFGGGICEAEERLFRMIGYDSKASKVAVWVGQELSDESAIRKVDEK
jgi:hypothetical protein